jgi:hypothetical protein
MSPLPADRTSQIVAAALEQTAFMPADPVAHDPRRLGEMTRCAVIRYDGPLRGEVYLHTTPEFIRALAANLMGIDPDSPDIDAYVDDAIKELANIIGGSVLHELGAQTMPLKLGLPQLASDTPAPPPDASTCLLDCEGEPLFVSHVAYAAPGGAVAGRAA